MKSGHIDFGGETGIDWFFLPRMTDYDVEEFCEREHITQHYGGAGLPYAGRPIVRHSTGHTLITQRVGLDV